MKHLDLGPKSVFLELAYTAPGTLIYVARQVYGLGWNLIAFLLKILFIMKLSEGA